MNTCCRSSSFAPIYQPVQSFAYSQDRLKLPDTIRGIEMATPVDHGHRGQVGCSGAGNGCCG